MESNIDGGALMIELGVGNEKGSQCFANMDIDLGVKATNFITSVSTV